MTERPAPPDDHAPLTTLTATALARMIASREVSSFEVVQAHVEHIDEVNPELHAVVAMDREASLAAARAADAAIARDERSGPLHGVPFTVKDWIEAEGLPCAAGQEARRNLIPRQDATVVARMRDAGAILLGKTKPGVDDAAYPRARNPIDPARTTGGSSAGEAAIIAAGGSPIGLGSDSGGSLRFPAHCCGITTLKPSAGLVPITGHFPRVGGMGDPRTQIGPMARSVADLALVLPIIAGPDGRDPAVVPLPLRSMADVEVRGLRVAVIDEVSGVRPTADVLRVLGDAARWLAEAGAVVEPARPSRIDDALEITQGYWRRPASWSWSEWRPDGRPGLSGEESARLLFAWDRFNRDMLAFMKGWDLILTPVAPWVAPLVGAEQTNDYIYTLPFSLTGWPCAVVPGGASGEGLPIGVQLVAGPWRDDVALAAAAVVERARSKPEFS